MATREEVLQSFIEWARDTRKARDKAIAIPGNENAFKRYRLNIWTEQASRWLSLDLWDKGGKYFSMSARDGSDRWPNSDMNRGRRVHIALSR